MTQASPLDSLFDDRNRAARALLALLTLLGIIGLVRVRRADARDHLRELHRRAGEMGRQGGGDFGCGSLASAGSRMGSSSFVPDERSAECVLRMGSFQPV